MEFQYSKIKNPETASFDDLEKEIGRLDLLSDFYDGKQQAQKRFLNSMYGALASVYFSLSNVDVAEAITLQGQDLNHFSENCVNMYFIKVLPTETEFLKKYGVNTDKPIRIDLSKGRLTPNPPLDHRDESYSHIKGDYSATIIGDTDSIYIEFGRIANQLGVPVKDQINFTVDLWNNHMAAYMNKCYEAYAKHYNCKENLELLELEKISSTVIAFSKKHYILDKGWEEPGIFLEPLSHVSYTGIETIQGGTPAFMRKCQKDFYNFVLKKYSEGLKPTADELLELLKKYKRDMATVPVEDICKGASMNNYDKFVLDDKNSLRLVKGCPVHVRGSAVYNNELYKHKKYMTRYSFIKSSDKIKWYYTSDKRKEAFAYLPNNFPSEFAPAIDFNIQFDKLLLEPLNRTVKILGYPEFTPTLCFTKSLF